MDGKVYSLRLNFQKTQINHALQRYKKQCLKSFGNKAFTDNGMAYAFTIGIHNHNFPFLQMIIDIYMRDSLQRALYYNKYVSTDRIYDIHTLSDYTIHDWASRYNVKRGIRNDIIFDSIASGIDKYLRLQPRIHINPLMLVKDDIYSIAQYFLIANNLIQNILNNHSQYDRHNQSIRFQFDFAIICNESVQKKGYVESSKLVNLSVV